MGFRDARGCISLWDVSSTLNVSGVSITFRSRCHRYKRAKEGRTGPSIPVQSIAKVTWDVGHFRVLPPAPRCSCCLRARGQTTFTEVTRESLTPSQTHSHLDEHAFAVFREWTATYLSFLSFPELSRSKTASVRIFLCRQQINHHFKQNCANVSCRLSSIVLSQPILLSFSVCAGVCFWCWFYVACFIYLRAFWK